MALGFMRRHKRWLFGFLWVVIAAFIVLYIPVFFGSDQTGRDIVARVGKRSISVAEFQNAFRQQLRAFERQGRRLDMETAKQFGLPERVLEGMIDQAVVAQEAQRLGLMADDATVKQALTNDPQFRINGRFMGGAELKRLLDLQGLSEAEFLENIRAGLLRDQLEALVTAGLEPTPAEVEREYRQRSEQVRIEYVLVPTENVRPDTADVAAVKARFETARESYRFPERRVLSVLLIDREATKREVAVTDREIETYHQSHAEDFTQPEQVCASHILVKVKTDPQEKDGHSEADARKLAESLLAQVRKGADFAALAKKSSEDPGSAPNGGSLGCFPHGQMVPEFDTAAFALEAGQVSAVVQSSFGFHIIRVASRQPEEVRPLAAVRDQIRQTLLTEETRKRVDEKSGAIAAKLRGGDSLEETAAAAGFTTQKVGPVALGSPADPLSAQALASAFEIKVGKTHPDPFRVPKGVAFVAVVEVQPPRLPELKEVEDQVRRDIVQSQVFEKAHARAAELRTRAEREGLEKAAKALGLTRKETPSLVGRGRPLGELGSSMLLERAVYGLAEKTLSDPVRVPTGYAVLSVIEKKSFDPVAFEKEKAGIVDSLRTSLRRRVFESYLNQATRRFKVERTEAFLTALGE
jgi:peptidyl-prolyl cis-trans isomerase D